MSRHDGDVSIHNSDVSRENIRLSWHRSRLFGEIDAVSILDVAKTRSHHS